MKHGMTTTKSKIGEMQKMSKGSPASMDKGGGKAPKGTGHGQKSPAIKPGKTMKDFGMYKDTKISGSKGTPEGKLTRQGASTLLDMAG